MLRRPLAALSAWLAFISAQTTYPDDVKIIANQHVAEILA